MLKNIFSRVGLQIIEWFCSYDYVEMVQGDLVELYELRIAKIGFVPASFKFFFDCISAVYRFFNKGRTNYSTNNIDMYRINLITAIRNLKKNKLTSGISIFGLVLAMTSAIMIGQYIHFESSFDNFHNTPGQIVRVNMDLVSKGDVSGSAGTYHGLGEEAKEQFPEIENYFTMTFNSMEHSQMQYEKDGILTGGKVNYVHHMQHAVFDILKFNVLDGSLERALIDTKSVVITATLAQRLYQSNDVVGKPIYWDGRLFEITAVVEDLPENSHLQFELMLPWADFEQLYPEYSENVWQWYGYYNYYLLKKDVDMSSLEGKLNELVSERRKQYIGKSNILLAPIQEIHWDSNLTFEPRPSSKRSSVIMLSVIALLILIIAYTNYINMISSTHLRRAKEIGIRKVIGSTRKMLISQLLTESLLINLSALVPALFLVYFVSQELPNLIDSFPKFYLWTMPSFWIILLLSVTGLGVLSGIYPALSISAHKAIDILRGVFIKHGSGARVYKSLIVTQFVIASMLMFFTIVVNMQLNFMLKSDLGADIDQTLVLRTPLWDESGINLLASFRDEVLRHPGISSMSYTTSLPGIDTFGHSIRLLSSAEDSYVTARLDVDENYLDVYNIPIVSGRGFSLDFTNDDNAILINERVTELLNVTPEDIINREVVLRRDTVKVIGVIANYHHSSLHHAYQPIVLGLNGDVRYASVKINTTNVTQTIEDIQRIWQGHFDGMLFDHFFASDEFNKLYKKEQELSLMINVFSSMALIIACLGLFALSLFAMINRRKEVGVRKVLGAPNLSIFWNLSRETMTLIGIASLVAMPLSYFISNLWLSNFANRISVEFGTLLIPPIAIFSLALLTISYNLIKATRVNLSETLRQE
jgi:putative ABC transport system permease protein